LLCCVQSASIERGGRECLCRDFRRTADEPGWRVRLSNVLGDRSGCGAKAPAVVDSVAPALDSSVLTWPAVVYRLMLGGGAAVLTEDARALAGGLVGRPNKRSSGAMLAIEDQQQTARAAAANNDRRRMQRVWSAPGPSLFHRGLEGLKAFRQLLTSAPHHEPGPSPRKSPPRSLPPASLFQPIHHLASAPSDRLTEFAARLRVTVAEEEAAREKEARAAVEAEARERALKAAAAEAAEARVRAAEAASRVGDLEDGTCEVGGRDEALGAIDGLLAWCDEAIDEAAAGADGRLPLPGAAALSASVEAVRSRAAAVQARWAEEVAESSSGEEDDGDGTPGALRRPLTTEEEATVQAAWRHGDHDNNVVCSLAAGAGGSSVDILGKHFGRMRSAWLFDESINAYMFLLQERDKRRCAGLPGAIPSHFMSSFFFEKVGRLQHARATVLGWGLGAT